MTDFRRADEVLDEEAAHGEEEAKTLVAANPLIVRDLLRAAPQGADVPAESGSRAEPPASTTPVGGAALEVGADALTPVELPAALRESALSVDDSEIEIVGLPPAAIMPPPRDSAEALRDSEVDRLRAELSAVVSETVQAEAAAPGGQATPVEVTEIVAPASKKSFHNEVTERISVLPRTHLFANSIAPTAAPKSQPPAAAPRGPLWKTVLAAAALIGLGVGLANLQQRRAAEPVPAVALEAASPSAHATTQPSAAPEPAPVAVPEPAPAPAEPVIEALPTQLIEGEIHPSGLGTRARPDRQVELVSSAPMAEPRLRVKAPAKAAAVGLPAQPSREDVVRTMQAAMPDLTRCTGGRRGVIDAKLSVRSNGRVSYALVEGSFAGTAEGTCLAQALREVRFPEFSDPMLRLTYPLQF